VLLSLACGCLSLDPFLWKAEPQDSYELDNFTGDFRECDDIIDSLGPVDPSEVHYVTFASEGNTIWSILLHSDSVLTSSDTLIVYFYGRTQNIDFYWPRTRLLHETGFPVLVVEYPGYGRSTGEPTEEGIYAAGRSALAHVRAHLGNPVIVVYAYSTGTWIGCELASTDTGIVRLVLEAPYRSMETLVQDAVYLNIPADYVTTLKGNNIDKIRKVFIPFLWLHGEDDQTLNIETHGYPIWESYPGDEGWRITVPGADHDEVPTKIGYAHYAACVGQFVRGAPTDPLFVHK